MTLAPLLGALSPLAAAIVSAAAAGRDPERVGERIRVRRALALVRLGRVPEGSGRERRLRRYVDGCDEALRSLTRADSARNADSTEP